MCIPWNVIQTRGKRETGKDRRGKGDEKVPSLDDD
jgi:hypothetical protein